ncbi:MAG: SMC family ATPase [Candidatus Diapherotrites archaeon]|nr:SMC family ATPase [Candidatus Diapherotrites archaeon]
MLSKIKLENWRTHKDSEFEFTQGTNVLIGNSGSGKTSVMDAICYGLFGTFPAIQRRETQIEQLIMNTPHLQDYAKIELEFKHNQNTYSLERTIYRNKTPQAKLLENNRLIAGPKVKEVTEKLEHILEFNYDLFARAIYSEQNNIDYFLRLPAAQRKEKFDSILDLEKYETARSLAVKVKNKIKTLAEEREQFAQAMEQQINVLELQDLEKKAQQTKEHIQKKHLQKQEFPANLEKLVLNQRKWEEKQAEFLNLQKNLTHTQIQIENLRKEIQTSKYLKETRMQLEEKIKQTTQELKQIREQEKQKAVLEEKQHQIQAGLNKLKKEIHAILDQLPQGIKTTQELYTKQTELKKQIEESEETLKRIDENLQNIHQELNQGRENFGKLEGKESEENDNLNSLKKAGAHCPVCRKKLEQNEMQKVMDDANKNLEQIVHEKKQCKEQIALLEETIRNQKQEIEKMRIELKKKANQSNTLEMLEKSFELLEKSKKEQHVLEEQEKEHLQIMVKLATEFSAQRIKEKEHTLKELEQALELEQKQPELENAEKVLQEIQKKINTLNFSEKEYKESMTHLEQTKAEEKFITQEIAMLTELSQTMEAKIYETKNKQNEVQKYKEHIDELKHSQEQLSIFVNVLGQTQAELRLYLIETINQAMQDLWERIYPYKDFTDIKLDISDNSYDLKVKKAGLGWIPIEGTLSGGEKSTAALITRIAFSFVLARNLGWLILDEPTHNLDSNIIARLSLMMREHLPELVDQVFLITHEKEMENAASGTLYVLERDKDNNGITKPVQKI